MGFREWLSSYEHVLLAWKTGVPHPASTSGNSHQSVTLVSEGSDSSGLCGLLQSCVTHVHTHVHTHTCMHTHIYTHISMHVHTVKNNTNRPGSGGARL